MRGLLAPKKSIPRSIEISVSTAVAASVLLTWCLLSYLQLVSSAFLPRPDEVWTAFVRVVSDGSLFEHMQVSLTEIYIAFFLSSIIAVPLGIFMGSFRIVAAAIEPIVNFMRYLPVTALIPLLILWIGIGIEEKIAVIFLGTFFQQIVLCADVSANVSDELYNVSYTLGVNRRQVIYRVMLPATLPGVMDTLRVTMGWAWTFLVVAELVAASAGLGYMILQAMRGLHPATIFVGIFTIGILGLITDQAFKLAKRWFLPWTVVR